MATIVGKWIRKGAKALSVIPGPLGLAGKAVSVITAIKDAKKAGASQAQAMQIATTPQPITGESGNAGGSTNLNFGADFLGIGGKKREEKEKAEKQKQMLIYGGGALALITIVLLLTRKQGKVSRY